jgi:hypothetical protein
MRLPTASDPAARTRLHERLTMGLVLAFFALGVFDLSRLALSHALAARDQDWEAAAQVLRKRFANGDLIVAAPGWVDPMMRLHLGDLIPLAVAARPDSDRFARVWEVSIRGASAPESAPPARCDTVHDGRVRVRLCQRPAARVRYDFVDHLFADARVSLIHHDAERPCSFADNRMVCRDGSGPPVTQVAPIIGEIDYAPHRCLLAPPPILPGEILRIEWNDVPLGARLVGHAGIHSFYARKSASGPVHVALRAAGRPLLAFDQHNEDGWQRFEVGTADLAGRHAAVRVEISSPLPPDRKLCLALEARD